jgi:hypothetical protein
MSAMRAICHFARQTSLWGIATVPDDHSPKVISSTQVVFDLQQITVARAPFSKPTGGAPRAVALGSKTPTE